jgi:hypothetical protein
MTVDGVPATEGWIDLLDDGSRHTVDIVLGTIAPLVRVAGMNPHDVDAGDIRASGGTQ